MVIDSIPKSKTSALPDSVLAKRGLSKDAIDVAITHVAKGYRRTDLTNKKVWLVEEAVVTYGDITLKADSIFDHYSWSNGGTTTQIVVSQPGTYFVTASDCSLSLIHI